MNFRDQFDDQHGVGGIDDAITIQELATLDPGGRTLQHFTFVIFVGGHCLRYACPLVLMAAVISMGPAKSLEGWYVADSRRGGRVLSHEGNGRSVRRGRLRRFVTSPRPGAEHRFAGHDSPVPR
jgi:hypothetical protein